MTLTINCATVLCVYLHPRAWRGHITPLTCENIRCGIHAYVESRWCDTSPGTRKISIPPHESPRLRFQQRISIRAHEFWEPEIGGCSQLPVGNILHRERSLWSRLVGKLLVHTQQFVILPVSRKPRLCNNGGMGFFPSKRQGLKPTQDIKLIELLYL